MKKITECSSFIKEKISIEPQLGIILGTGLGRLIDEIEISEEISYEDLPHFPVSTVEGHSGRLIFGKIGQMPVMVMQGRFHYYEGYSMKQVTFPVRVMKMLGVSQLIVSNVSGSTNAEINKGDLVIISDHINLQPENPLRGQNLDAQGPRFPDLFEVYSPRLRQQALEIAAANGYRAQEGVYASIQGPNLETKAEYKWLHKIGADCVGMSTVPEVLVAVHCGLEIFGISVITDKGIPVEELEPVTLEEVIAVAMEAEPKMTQVIRQLIEKMTV